MSRAQHALTPRALVVQNLLRKPVRTIMLAVVSALFAFTLFCGTLLGNSVGAGTRMMAERLGADALFVPHGYENKVQNSLLRGEPSSFYLNGALAPAIAIEPGVDKVTSQLFIATLNAACCTLPVQLIGIDPATDFVVKPWMNSVLSRPLLDHEVVVGNKIAGEVGSQLLLFGKEFTIAARLDPTGMGFDTSVFMDINRARRLLMQSELGPHLNLPDTVDTKTFVSSTLIKVASGASVKETVNAVLQKHAMEYNLDFVVVASMITDIASRLGILSGIFYGVSAMLWLLAVCVLGLVFFSMVQERKREFGLLRVIGASRSALAGVVVKEALIISAAGALAGVLAGCLVLFPFSTYIDSILQLPSLRPGLYVPLGIGLGVLALGAITGPLACIPAVIRLSRIDAYLSLREEG